MLWNKLRNDTDPKNPALAGFKKLLLKMGSGECFFLIGAVQSTKIFF